MPTVALIMGGTSEPSPDVGYLVGLDMLYLNPNTATFAVPDISRYIFSSPFDADPLMEVYFIGSAGLPDRLLVEGLLRHGDYQSALSVMLDGNDILIGTPLDDNLIGLAGDDTFRDSAGADRYDGGSGIDTVAYDASSSTFSIIVDGNGAAIADLSHPSDPDRITNTEFIQFSDLTIDVGYLTKAHKGTANQYQDVLDLYVGYLDRAPDAYGMAYWVSRLKDGMSLSDVARSFYASDEAAALRQPVHTLNELVSQAYRDVLDRDADQAGLDYWVGQLASGRLAMDQFALAFVNGASPGSADNQFLDAKKVLGGYYALVSGLTDVPDAAAVMHAADGQTPGTHLDDLSAAFALVESYAVAAELPGSAELRLGVIEDAFSGTAPPTVIAANRALLAQLIATNLFGVNDPSIAALEADYMELWAHDVSRLFGY